jgi:hypothetical protein
MTRGSRVLLALGVLAVAAPVGAKATHALFDYDSAVDALVAVDPTIEPAANDHGKDFAVGGFRGDQNNKVGFSAHSGPLGQDAQGHLSETIPGFFPMSSTTFQARFRVVCLKVIGNEAAMGLARTDAASNDEQADVFFAVRDNALLAMPDEYAFVAVELGDVPETCVAAISDAAFFIESGNILVHDALP